MASDRSADGTAPLGWAQEQLLLGILDAERRINDAGEPEERADLALSGVRWDVAALVQAPDHPNLPAIVGHAATILERRALIARTPPTRAQTAGKLNRWVRLTPTGRALAEHLAAVRTQAPHDLAQPRGRQRTRQMPPPDVPVLAGMTPDLADAVRPLLTALSPADLVTAGMALTRAGLAAGAVATRDHRAWFTPEEVATLVRIGPDTIKAEIRCGALPAVRFGRGYRVSPESVQAWMSREWVDGRQRNRRQPDAPEVG